MPVVPGRGVVAGFVRGPRGNPQFQENPPQDTPLFTPPLTDAGTVVLSITPSSATVSPAAPALQTNGTGSVSSNSAVGSLAVPIGSGIQPGDLLVIVAGWNVISTGSTFTTPSGWSVVDSTTDTAASATPLASVGTFYKIANGSEAGTTVTVSHSVTGRCAAVSAAFDNLAGTFDGALPTETRDNAAAGGQTSQASPSLTGLTTVDLAVLLLGGKEDTTSATATTFTAPSGYTVAIQASGTSAAGNNGCAAIAYKVKTDTSDETSPTWSTNEAIHWLSVSIPAQPLPSSVGESAQFADTGTVGLVITPSGADVYASGTVYTDAATVGMVITPSAAEVHEITDAATVGLTITPSAIAGVAGSTILQEFDGIGTGSGTTTVINVPAGGTTQGTTLLVFLRHNATSVTDSKGNTYVKDQGLTGTGLNIAGSVFRCTNHTALVSGDTITATHASGSSRAGIVLEVDGMLSSPVDSAGFGTYDNSTSTPQTTATVTGAGATTNTDDRVFALWTLDFAASAPTSGLGYNIEGQITTGGTVRTIVVEDKVVSSTGTQSADISWTGSSSAQCAILATYKVNASSGAGETAQFVDSGTVVLAITPSGADVYTPGGAVYTDAATVALAITPSAAETAQFVDTGTVALAITPSAAETAQFVDAATVSIAITPSAADTAQYVDSSTVSLAVTPSGADTQQAVDTGTVIMALSPSSVEVGIIHSDATTVPVTLSPSGVDTAQYVDTATVGLTVTPSSTDTAQYVESVTVGMVITPSAVENAQFVDTGTVTEIITPSSAETTQFVDAATAIVAVTPSATESQQNLGIDAATVALAITPSMAEVAVFVDTGTVVIALTPSAVEVGITHTDAATVPVTLTPSGVDTAQYVDTATVGMTVTPSGTDVAGYVDTGTPRVTLTPSSSDTAQYVDTGIVPVALVPSAADTAQKVESGTVPLTITPSASEQFITPTVDSATVSMFLTVSDVSSTQMQESATVPLAITPSSTDIAERAFLDTAEIDMLISVDGSEFIAKEEIATVSLIIQPGVLYEFAGDGDVLPIHITPSVLEGFLFQDAVQVYMELDGFGDESGSSLSTFGTVYLDIQPATALELEFAVDSATVGLLITPFAVIEVKIIADYLLVGVLSNHYTAALRDNQFPTALRENQYTVALHTGWQTTWHGRGDE